MTGDIRIAASEETVARWHLAAERARFPFHEWLLVALDTASDPDAGQVVDVLARLRTVEADLDNHRLYVAEYAGYAQIAELAAAEARVEALREALRAIHQNATLPEGWDAAEWWKHVASKRREIARDALEALAAGTVTCDAALAVSGNQPQ